MVDAKPIWPLPMARRRTHLLQKIGDGLCDARDLGKDLKDTACPESKERDITPPWPGDVRRYEAEMEREIWDWMRNHKADG